jgi:transcriptional regulator with XRE-family HTH domain
MSKQPQPTLGRTQELRRERQWTQRHLALAAGLSERTVQRIERGLPATSESLLAIASALDVSTDELAMRPRLMFPVDVATLTALLQRSNGALAVAAAPGAALPEGLLARVDRSLRERKVSSLLRMLGAKKLRVLATELQTASGSAVGLMVAPRGGTFSAAFRVA